MAKTNAQRKKVAIEKVGPERKSADGKTTEQDVIEVSVYYTKGGYNCFNGNVDAGGYYISMSPMTIESREGSAFVAQRSMMFAGLKKHVREGTRFSAKTLDEVGEQAKISTDLLNGMKAKILGSPGTVFASELQDAPPVGG